MQLPEFQSFPGKVLLFGEYLVIQGEEALAIPIWNFNGKLELESSFQEDNIAPFIQYLGALPNIHIDQDLIEEIPLDQLIFKSNIPIGYGAGSSGALTAAVYDAFVLKHDGLLQEALASMEDFFHGSSSGLDPIVSYQQKPTITIDNRMLNHFYLLDTGKSRKTAPLVEIFKRKADAQSFKHLAGFNSEAIRAMQKFDLAALQQAVSSISVFQFDNFKEMIPEGFKQVWEDAIEDPHLDIKLCGAGGGGFLLVFSEDGAYANTWAAKNNVDLIEIIT